MLLQNFKRNYNVDTTKELPTVLSFCSGYGGIERGLNLAGVKHRVVAYVEIEAFAIANLVAKMEEGKLDPAPIFTDLKTFPAHLFRDCADLITGGYPCQPFSGAGQRKGTDDPRHLWPYIREHINAIRPARCLFENVEGHISLGLSSVISDLEEDGYRTAWGIFSAREVGAPHQRKRVFIMGDTKHNGSSATTIKRSLEATSIDNAQRQKTPSKSKGASQSGSGSDISGELADPSSKGLQGREWLRDNDEKDSRGKKSEHGATTECGNGSKQIGEWKPEPRLGRVVDGCANRVDRIRLLGNGVVPQTAAKAWQVLSQRF